MWIRGLMESADPVDSVSSEPSEESWGGRPSAVGEAAAPALR